MRGKLFQLAIAANIVVLVLNIYLAFRNSSSDTASQPYPYLSRRIFTEDPNDLIINFVPLREKLREYLSPAGDKVSLYFEYLPSGVSVGVNDRQEIRLSSLAKVPTVMATLKQISKGALRDTDQLTIKAESRDPQFGSLWKKEAGEQVSVSEAMRLAIVESDNTAHNLLLAAIPVEEINKVYDSLDIPFRTENGYPLISAKNYSSILRALYLSSYLDREDSNHVLEIMTQTIYRDKLPGQLPSDVLVAHKVGVFERQAPNTSAFSDCGIVYEPQRPFLICMMSEGSDDQAKQYMSGAAKLIYDYVSAYK
ncbi:MAG: class A beta-lactamase-related serine hydrolase [Candidatus Saccharibacteria bacterium]|nr:class A beta-lactamase-related serine hydrolase [Candidatus Saccharibacteria bacterium]